MNWVTVLHAVCLFTTQCSGITRVNFGVGKCVVIHVITWITMVKTIKQQTGAVCGCFAKRSKSRGFAYDL